MDLSGFYLSGAWADDDDDELELSGTLFPKQSGNARKGAQGASTQPLLDSQAVTGQSKAQVSPATSLLDNSYHSSTSDPFQGRTSTPETENTRFSVGKSASTSSRTVTPLMPPVHREGKLSSRIADALASHSPRDLEKRNSASSRTGRLGGVERSLQDITLCLELTDPNLPPPLQTPTTPEDQRARNLDFGSHASSSPVSETFPTASNDFYSTKLSSTTNVEQVSTLKSRVGTQSGAWRYDAVSQQDGLRMHHSGYSPLDDGNEFETVPLPRNPPSGYAPLEGGNDFEAPAPPRNPHSGVVEPKIPFTIHEDQVPPGLGKIDDSKPLPPPPPPPSPSNSVIYTGAICLAQVIAGVVLAQGLIPARTISESLYGRGSREPGEILWMTSVCTLSAAAFALPAARIADVGGCKTAFVGSLLWLMCWTEVIVFGGHVQRAGDSGVAFVCLCRAMQGVGLAFLVPTSFDMLHRAYPSNVYSALAIISGILGLVIGGVVTCLFATPDNWKWSFVSLTVILLALGVLGMLIVPTSHRRRDEAIYDRLWVRLDALGMITSLLGLLMLSAGLNLLSIVPFNTAYAYAILGIGILLIGGFLYSQRMALRPIFDLAAFTNRAYLVLACIATYWGSFAIWLWYLIQILEHLRGWKPILISASLVPLAMVSITSASTLYHVTRFVSPELLVFATAVLSCIGSTLMATAAVDEIYWRNTFFSILLMSPGIVMLTVPAMRLLDDNTLQRFPSSLTALTFGVAMFAGSTALGVAGIIEKSIDGGLQNILSEYRGPQYLGIGISGLGAILSFVLFITVYIRR